MAVAQLHVLDPEMLLLGAPERLREQRPAGGLEGELAATRLEGRAVDADDVAQVEVGEGVEGLLAEDVALGVHLELAAAIGDVEEGGAAVAATPGQAAGDAVGLIRLLARLEVAVRGVDVFDRHDAVELVRIRVDPLLAQALELRPAVVHGPDAIDAVRGLAPPVPRATWPVGVASVRSW